MTSTEQGQQDSTTVEFVTVTPDDVRGQYNQKDLDWALRASNKIVSAKATPSHVMTATIAASADGGLSCAAGRKIYFTSLTEQATPATRKAAEQAFADSLAKSDELRAERHTEQNKRDAQRAAEQAEYAAQCQQDSTPDGDANPFTEPADYTEQD